MMSDVERERASRLLENLAPDLLSYFARRVDVPADAADLTSETLVVMCRRVRDLPVEDREVRLWAFGVARRVLSGQRRTFRRRHLLTRRLRHDMSLPGAEPDDDLVENVRDAVSRLDALDREIVRLIHWDGFSQAEVAQLLERPAGTIRSRYTRARATLRGELAPQGLDDRPSRRTSSDAARP